MTSESLVMQTVVMPTTYWFDPVREYGTGNRRAPADLKQCFEKTLTTVATFARDKNTNVDYLSPEQYHTMLTHQLMRESDDVEAIVGLTEISAHFYDELIAYFKAMQLPPELVQHIKFNRWLYDDAIVDTYLRRP